MKGEKINNFLMGALIVLTSTSIYNINAVTKGISPQYMQGLVIVALSSMALSILFITIMSKPKKVSKA